MEHRGRRKFESIGRGMGWRGRVMGMSVGGGERCKLDEVMIYEKAMKYENTKG